MGVLVSLSLFKEIILQFTWGGGVSSIMSWGFPCRRQFSVNFFNLLLTFRSPTQPATTWVPPTGKAIFPQLFSSWAFSSWGVVFHGWAVLVWKQESSLSVQDDSFSASTCSSVGIFSQGLQVFFYIPPSFTLWITLLYYSLLVLVTGLLLASGWLPQQHGPGGHIRKGPVASSPSLGGEEGRGVPCVFSFLIMWSQRCW